MLIDFTIAGRVHVLYDINLPSPAVIIEQPVQCFNASSPTIGLGCEDSDPSFMASTIEECCVRLSGQFYRQTSGDQSCQACIGGLHVALEYTLLVIYKLDCVYSVYIASLPSQPCINQTVSFIMPSRDLP